MSLIGGMVVAESFEHFLHGIKEEAQARQYESASQRLEGYLATRPGLRASERRDALFMLGAIRTVSGGSHQLAAREFADCLATGACDKRLHIIVGAELSVARITPQTVLRVRDGLDNLLLVRDQVVLGAINSMIGWVNWLGGDRETARLYFVTAGALLRVHDNDGRYLYFNTLRQRCAGL